MYSSRLSPTFLTQLNNYWEEASMMALHKTYLYDNPLLNHHPYPLGKGSNPDS